MSPECSPKLLNALQGQLRGMVFGLRSILSSSFSERHCQPQGLRAWQGPKSSEGGGLARFLWGRQQVGDIGFLASVKKEAGCSQRRKAHIALLTQGVSASRHSSPALGWTCAVSLPMHPVLCCARRGRELFREQITPTPRLFPEAGCSLAFLFPFPHLLAAPIIPQEEATGMATFPKFLRSYKMNAGDASMAEAAHWEEEENACLLSDMKPYRYMKHDVRSVGAGDPRSGSG